MLSKRILVLSGALPAVACCYYAYNNGYNFAQEPTFAMNTENMALCHKKEEQQLRNHILMPNGMGVFVYGKEGSGKTFLVRRVVSDLQASGDVVAFYLYGYSDNSPRSFIESLARSIHYNIPRETIFSFWLGHMIHGADIYSCVFENVLDQIERTAYKKPTRRVVVVFDNYETFDYNRFKRESDPRVSYLRNRLMSRFRKWSMEGTVMPIIIGAECDNYCYSKPSRMQELVVGDLKDSEIDSIVNKNIKSKESLQCFYDKNIVDIIGRSVEHIEYYSNMASYSSNCIKDAERVKRIYKIGINNEDDN